MSRTMVSIGSVFLALAMTRAVPATAQGDADRGALRADIERRFVVLLLRDGVMLEPKEAIVGVRAVQVTGGEIAIDGEPVSGAEFRRRVGEDAEPVLRLSYLTSAEQRALFGGTGNGVTPDNAPPAGADAGPRPPRPLRRPRPPRSSDRVRIGGSLQVDEGEVVGDVVAIGGGARVDGQVTGDVVAIGGDVELGPRADVLGGVTVIGGLLRRDAGARVGGEINDVGWGQLKLLPGGLRGWTLPTGAYVWGSVLGSLFAFAATLTRLAVLCLLASLVIIFGHDHVERVGARAVAEPVKAGLVGLVIQLLFLPVLLVTIVAMIVTIIGIPLLALVPVALFAFALLFLVGFTAVSFDVGNMAAARFGWQSQKPYAIVALGIATVLAPVLLGRLVGLAGGILLPLAWTLLALGFLVEYTAWTVGLGAVALARFDRKVAPLPSV